MTKYKDILIEMVGLATLSATCVHYAFSQNHLTGLVVGGGVMVWSMNRLWKMI